MRTIATEATKRVERHRANQRRRNWAAGIPDMELGDRHEPAEYFAQVGFFAVLDVIGRAEPDHDWSLDGGDERDHDEFVAARRRDHQRVADWLKEAAVRASPNYAGCLFGDLRIDWPDRIPALKVWAGQQTLAKIANVRQKALPREVEDVLSAEAAIKGSSGLYRPCASTAIEDGFSVDAQDMKRVTPIGMELLAIVGLQQLPVTVYPDGALSYVVNEVTYKEVTYKFYIEKRNDYYGRWGPAERQ